MALTENIEEELIAFKKKVTYLQEMYESKQSMLEMTIVHMDELQEELQTSADALEKANKRWQDGANYAERLQKAILPDEEEISAIFPNSFVIFNPKFKLSGDFYWFGQSKSRKYVSVIDCTGHGIPGAMITMIIDSALNHLINSKKLKSPSNILLQLDEWVDNQLHTPNQSNEVQVRDGADAALIVYNEKKRELIFSGAHSPAYLVRKGEMTYIKGARYSIGENSDRKQGLNDMKCIIEPADRLFMFTDGITDQFGGEVGEKKFGRRQLKELLLQTCHLSMTEQQRQIDASLQKWRGKETQTDDMLLIGIQFD